MAANWSCQYILFMFVFILIIIVCIFDLLSTIHTLFEWWFEVNCPCVISKASSQQQCCTVNVHDDTVFISADEGILLSWLSNERADAVFECCTVPSLSPHLSVAPTGCPGGGRYWGLCYQPSAGAGAHPLRWAMTETAGPQGGPPP